MVEQCVLIELGCCWSKSRSLRSLTDEAHEALTLACFGLVIPAHIAATSVGALLVDNMLSEG